MTQVNQTYCGDHFAIYTRIKSLCCTPETCMMLYVNYNKRRLSRFPWTARRSNQSTLKEINLEYSLEGLQYFGHLMQRDPDAGKDWRQKEKGAAEDETVKWHHQLNRYESEQISGGSEGQEALVCMGLQKVELNLVTEQQHVNCIQFLKIHLEGLPWWLRLHAPNTGSLGLIPGQGTRFHMPQPKILHATANRFYMWGFSWWLSSKEFTCQCRSHGFDPWSRKTHMLQSSQACMPRLLSLCFRAREPQLLSPQVPQLLKPACSRACAHQQEKPAKREDHTPRVESSPRLPRLEESLCGSEDPAQP